MNDLALIAIGFLLGLVLAVVAVLAFALWREASMQRTESKNYATLILDHFKASRNALDMFRRENTMQIEKLRSEVALALSRMDAERLHDASLAIQRSSKQMSAAVATLTKAIYAQPAIDTGPETFGIEDEAADDARMLAEQNRWAAQPDPFAGLTEEEKNARVQQYFQNRQRNGISHFGSAPPAAGAGAYASLLEEAQQVAPPMKPMADFDDMAAEDGLDLSGKGELGE
jgi:hypothetical protein